MNLLSWFRKPVEEGEEDNLELTTISLEPVAEILDNLENSPRFTAGGGNIVSLHGPIAIGAGSVFVSAEPVNIRELVSVKMNLDEGWVRNVYSDSLRQGLEYMLFYNIQEAVLITEDRVYKCKAEVDG